MSLQNKDQCFHCKKEKQPVKVRVKATRAVLFLCVQCIQHLKEWYGVRFYRLESQAVVSLPVLEEYMYSKNWKNKPNDGIFLRKMIWKESKENYERIFIVVFPEREDQVNYQDMVENIVKIVAHIEQKTEEAIWEEITGE